MYNFYTIDGKKLIDFKPKEMHYANAIARFVLENEDVLELSYKEFRRKYPDRFNKYLYLLIKHLPLLFCSETNYTKEQTDDYFDLICCLGDMIGYLSPRELIQIFPVEKTYDGEKYQIKDYFHTIQKAEEMGMDEPLGNKVERFLWDFCNNDIDEYVVTWMEIINRKYQSEGGRDITLEFFEEQGLEIHTMEKQGNYLVDTETNERFEIKKLGSKLKKLFSVE